MAIHERPELALARQKLGDRQAERMVCRRTRPVLVLHERASRLTLAAKLAGKSAAATAATLVAIVERPTPEDGFGREAPIGLAGHLPGRGHHAAAASFRCSAS